MPIFDASTSNLNKIFGSSGMEYNGLMLATVSFIKSNVRNLGKARGRQRVRDACEKSKGSAEYTKLILKKATTGQTRRPTPVKKREKGVRLCPTYLKVCCLEYAR